MDFSAILKLLQGMGSGSGGGQGIAALASGGMGGMGSTNQPQPAQMPNAQLSDPWGAKATPQVTATGNLTGPMGPTQPAPGQGIAAASTSQPVQPTTTPPQPVTPPPEAGMLMQPANNPLANRNNPPIPPGSLTSQPATPPQGQLSWQDALTQAQQMQKQAQPYPIDFANHPFKSILDAIVRVGSGAMQGFEGTPPTTFAQQQSLADPRSAVPLAQQIQSGQYAGLKDKAELGHIQAQTDQERAGADRNVSQSGLNRARTQQLEDAAPLNTQKIQQDIQLSQKRMQLLDSEIEKNKNNPAGQVQNQKATQAIKIYAQITAILGRAHDPVTGAERPLTQAESQQVQKLKELASIYDPQSAQPATMGGPTSAGSQALPSGGSDPLGILGQ